jgi:hypothetical protein
MPRAPKGESRDERRQRVSDLRAQRAALRPAVIDPNQNYRLDESAAALGMSLSGLYTDIRNDKIEVVNPDGKRRTLIPGTELIRRALEDRAQHPALVEADASVREQPEREADAIATTTGSRQRGAVRKTEHAAGSSLAVARKRKREAGDRETTR